MDINKSASPNKSTHSRFAVATRGQIANQGSSPGTETSATFEYKHVAGCDSHDISFVYANWRTDIGAGDVDGANDITIKAALKVTNLEGVTLYFPVYFNGARSIVIKPGGTIESDPIAINLKKGDVFSSLTYVSVGSLGETWPVGLTVYGENGDGKANGADTTAGGANATVGVYGYHPVCIVGTPDVGIVRTPSILIVGDSVACGGGDGMNDKGFMVRAINNSYPYTVIARGGTTADEMVNKTGRRRIGLAKYHTHAVINFGTNDINNGTTLSVIQSRILDVCKQLASRGLKIYYATFTPRTTSTDNWATTVNQTTSNAFFVAGENSKRGIQNAWVRAKPAYVHDTIDVTAMVETAKNSGIWKAARTDDGIHPNDAGHTDIAVMVAAKLTTFAI